MTVTKTIKEKLFDIEGTKNVLLLMPDKHMGNVIVSLAAIAAIRKSFGESRCYLVMDEAYRDIAEAAGFSKAMLLFPGKSLREGASVSRLLTYAGFIRSLRGVSPDMAVDLEGRHASSLMTFFSGARLRIGSSTANRPFLYNRTIELSAGRHKVFSYIEIAEALGIEVHQTECRLKSAGPKKENLLKKLRDKGVVPGSPVVCIHAGAGKSYKKWTAEGFAEVADELSDHGLCVVIIGGKGDSSEAHEVMSRLRRSAFNFCGELSLGELIALFGISSLYIGNDSGPMHLASATGVPVVALFGCADEKRWRPLSEKSVVLRGEERCKKCRGKNCKYDFKCIRSISHDEVKEAAERLLAQK